MMDSYKLNLQPNGQIDPAILTATAAAAKKKESN
jgi:hypothetical protein